jgi:hypothetical protein
MAIEVEIDSKSKIVLDFWVSPQKKEYLTARKFFPGKEGQWFPDPKNGVYFPIETWEAMIPKLKEMIYYKNAPAGSPAFDEGQAVGKPQGEAAPSGDDF